MINYRVMHRLLARSRIFFIGKKDRDPVDQVYIHIYIFYQGLRKENERILLPLNR